MNESIGMLEELRMLESFVVLKYLPFQATQEYRMSIPPDVFRVAISYIDILFSDKHRWSDREIFDLYAGNYQQTPRMEQALINALVRYEYDKKAR